MMLLWVLISMCLLSSNSEGAGELYLGVSNNVVAKGMRGYRKIRMNRLPMTEEGVEINRVNLFEED